MIRALALAAALATATAACGSPPAPIVEQPTKPPPPAKPPTVEWNQLVGPIKAIEIATPDAAIAPKAKDVMSFLVDKPLDRRELRLGLDAVRALQGVADVAAHGEQLADGIKVIVDVSPQPTLHALVARDTDGNALPLPAQLTSAIGLPVNPGLLDAFGAQVRENYLARGYTQATVAWKETPAGTGALDVAIEIAPGRATTIASVDFKGNAHAKTADLLKVLGDGFTPSSPWNTDVIDRGQFLLVGYYFDHGYINVVIESPHPTGGAVAAIYTISEGDQFKVGTIELGGASAADAKKYTAMLGIKSGQVFNRSAIAAGIDKVNAALKASGQASQILAQSTIDPKKKLVNIKLDVVKSPS